jgi:hypothetical protein
VWQHPKDADSSCRAYVDFSIGDRGGNELVAVAEVIAAIRSLVRVVQLLQGLGIVGMQHRGIGILGTTLVNSLAFLNWKARMGCPTGPK